MRKYYQILLIFLVSTCFSFTLAAPKFSLTDALVYHVRYLVEIQNGNQPVLDYSLKCPLFLTGNLPPYQKLVFFQTKPVGVEFSQTTDNLSATFRIKRLDPGRSAKLEIEYTFVNYAINHDLTSVAGAFGDGSEYLNAEEGIECNDPRITSVAGELITSLANPLENAKRLFAYVNYNLQYTPHSEEPHSALRTLERGWGSCEDYSLLYTALCRAVRIPARYVSGFRFSPREIPRREIDLEPFAHAWVEIYLPQVGWVTVDPTYTYTVNNVKKVNYDFFGRILNDDRHLFFSYTRRQERTVIWNYESNHPAKVTTQFHIFIRKR